MEEIWKTRKERYQKQQLKYLRYVFNDNFVLALFFLFGGLAYAYADFLKVLPLASGHWIFKLTLALVLWSGLFLVKFASLLEKADVVFLSPLDYQMVTYLNLAAKSSLPLALTGQFLVWICALPFIVTAVGFSYGQSLVFLFVTATLKILYHNFALQAHYYPKFQTVTYRWGLRILALAILISFVTFIPLGILLLFGLILVLALSKRQMTKHLFAWNYAVAIEAQRQMGLYRLYNLFTDVPMVKSSVKRRKYLDIFLRGQSPYAYLFVRGFARKEEYANLWLRLTMLTFVITLFIDNGWLAGLIAVLFYYMLALQFLPLSKRYDEIVFTHLYPLDTTVKKKDLTKLLQKVMALSAFIMALGVGLGSQSWAFGGGVLVVLILLNQGLLKHLIARKVGD